MFDQEKARHTLIIAGNPSIEATQLIREFPALLLKDNDSQCTNSEQVFIKTMLLKLFQRQIMHFFAQRGLSTPELLKTPVVVLNDVQVLAGKKLEHTFYVPKVLFRKAMSWKSGVVIAGPYTGLIVNFHVRLPIQVGVARASRFWYEQRSGPDVRVYNADLSEIRDMFQSKEEFLDFAKGFEMYFDDLYKKWINGQPQLIRQRQHLFRLGRYLGIEIDQRSFQFLQE